MGISAAILNQSHLPLVTVYSRVSIRGAQHHRYFPAFEGQAADWENKLGTLDAVMSVLQTVQRKWVYLEPIFGRGALPKEQVCTAHADYNLACRWP